MRIRDVFRSFSVLPRLTSIPGHLYIFFPAVNFASQHVDEEAIAYSQSSQDI